MNNPASNFGATPAGEVYEGEPHQTNRITAEFNRNHSDHSPIGGTCECGIVACHEDSGKRLCCYCVAVEEIDHV